MCFIQNIAGDQSKTYIKVHIPGCQVVVRDNTSERPLGEREREQHLLKEKFA